MNIKNVGLCTLLATPTATQATRSHQACTKIEKSILNGLLFIVHYRKPSAAVMLEAAYDRLQAIADWQNFGFKPARFSPLISGTIHL